MCLAFTSDVPEPGDAIPLMAAGVPLILVRDRAGAIRVFHNVCRHRAGPLVDEDRGNCGGSFTCKYHGWNYTLDGRLRNARDFGAAAGFDPRQYGLVPLKVETWRSFVFVNADLQASPLAGQMVPLDRKIGRAHV